MTKVINSNLKKKIKKLVKLINLQFSENYLFSKEPKEFFYRLPALIYYSRKKRDWAKSLQSNFSNAIFVINSKEKNFKDKRHFSSPKIIPSSASIYIFDLTTTRSLRKEKIYSNYIAAPLKSLFLAPRSIFNLLKHGRFLFFTIKRFGGNYIIFKNVSIVDSNSKTRRYIPEKYSRTSFMVSLKENSINALALRWFNDFESMEGDIDEDIDILIADNEIKKLESILNEGVGIFPLDIYSSSGLPGTTYAGVPYYPFLLANSLLETKIISKNGFYIPNNENYILSLIYHVVYHKSTSSGLPIKKDSLKTPIIAEHDYKTIIQNLLNTNTHNEIEIHLKGLHDFLKKMNVSPAYDLILKLSNIKGRDDWYNYLINEIEDEVKNRFSYFKGLAVFVIREEANKIMKLPEVRDIFKNYGFDIILESKIINERKIIAETQIRGGNWGKGPFKISGGVPVYFFVTYDPFYVTPNKVELTQYPNIENRKIITVKRVLRDYFTEKGTISFNGVHSSDNFFESMDYLGHLCTLDQIEKVISESNLVKDLYESKFKIIKDLSRNSNRAKVSLIDYKGNKVIMKMYKKEMHRYLNREVFFLKLFSESEFSPQLIKVEGNCVFMEYFNNAKDFETVQGFVKPNYIVQLRSIFKCVFEKDITLLDVNPSNVLLVDGKIKLIDFEFATPYDITPDSLSKAYELSAIPKSFKGDIPVGAYYDENVYNIFWKNRLFLTKKQFLSINNKLILSILMRLNFILFKFQK